MDRTSHGSFSSNNDVEVDFSEVELGPRIGLGCFGEVFKARWRQTTVAVKRLFDQSLSQASLKVSRLGMQLPQSSTGSSSDMTRHGLPQAMQRLCQHLLDQHLVEQENGYFHVHKGNHASEPQHDLNMFCS